MISPTRSHGEADVNAMEISVMQQLVVVLEKKQKRLKQKFSKHSRSLDEWGDMVNMDFLFFSENWRGDFEFLSTVVC